MFGKVSQDHGDGDDDDDGNSHYPNTYSKC